MEKSEAPRGPLAGLRVLDLGHLLAGPFAATMLGDFGAEVIKVERPGEGDAARFVGPVTEAGPIWWKSLARNKHSLALDWAKPEARDIIELLVKESHVLIENFRPGVLERRGLGPDVLLGWNPRLVILRISGYGQTGPYSSRPGFGKAAEAMSGVVHLTGMPDGAPMHAGFPLGDMTAGLMGAYGVVLALLALERGLAQGQVIDLPIYEAPMRLLDFHIPVRTGSSVVPARNGNQQPMGLGISGIFRSRDERWVTYSGATLSVAKRVLRLVGGDALSDDPRFSTLAAIYAHGEEINCHVAAWMAERRADDIVREFGDAQAVAAIVFDADAILNDPHIASRGSVVSVQGEDIKVVGVVPKLSETPGAVRWLGPKEVGRETTEILRAVVGLREHDIAALRSSGTTGG